MTVDEPHGQQRLGLGSTHSTKIDALALHEPALTRSLSRPTERVPDSPEAAWVAGSIHPDARCASARDSRKRGAPPPPAGSWRTRGVRPSARIRSSPRRYVATVTLQSEAVGADSAGWPGLGVAGRGRPRPRRARPRRGADGHVRGAHGHVGARTATSAASSPDGPEACPAPDARSGPGTRSRTERQCGPVASGHEGGQQVQLGHGHLGEAVQPEPGKSGGRLPLLPGLGECPGSEGQQIVRIPEVMLLEPCPVALQQEGQVLQLAGQQLDRGCPAAATGASVRRRCRRVAARAAPGSVVRRTRARGRTGRTP